MSLPDVASGDPHVTAHNAERHLINAIQAVTDTTFLGALDPHIQAMIDADEAADLYPGTELAYVENATGTAYTVPATTPATITGMLISVPPCPTPWELKFGGSFGVTVVGGGLVGLQVFDVTSGTPGTKIIESYFGLTSSFLTLYSGFAHTMDFRKRMAPTATDTQYVLQTVKFQDASSSLAGAIANSTSEPTYLQAVSR